MDQRLSPSPLFNPEPTADRESSGATMDLGHTKRPAIGLLMCWVEMGFMGWVLKWSVFGWVKWVVLVNGVGRGGFYINAG